MVVASIGLLVALGGTSVAAVSQLPARSVGTPQLKSNAVTSPKVLNRSLLAVDFKQGQIPQRPEGPERLPRAGRHARRAGCARSSRADRCIGSAGPAGAVTRLTAVVNASGSLGEIPGHDLRRPRCDGRYEVIFNQDVAGCTYVATLGDPTAAVPPAGRSALHLVPATRTGSSLQRGAAAASATDRPFHLVVVC